MLKAANALIAWNSIDEHDSKAPPGSVAIGPLESMDESDTPYHCTINMPQRHHVLLVWYQLVYAYGVNPYVAHRAFLLIEEYQALIKGVGFGPAKGEPGHDPDIPFGRAVNYPVPELKIFTSGRITHFWPEERRAPEITEN